MPNPTPFQKSEFNEKMSTQDQAGKFVIKGHSDRCSSIISSRDHILIGISPFNSRFSPNYVGQLLTWAHSEFKKVDILLPDEDHAALLLIATTQHTGKSARKVRKELNRHRRVINSTLDILGDKAGQTQTFEFCDFIGHRGYQSLYSLAANAYEESATFRAACIDMSLHAIRGRQQGTSSGRCESTAEMQLEKVTPYVLAELPFYLGTPDFIPVASSVFAYHRVWPIGQQLWEKNSP